jgi:two-component system sensor histidine kinase/response regulator
VPFADRSSAPTPRGGKRHAEVLDFNYIDSSLIDFVFQDSLPPGKVIRNNQMTTQPVPPRRAHQLLARLIALILALWTGSLAAAPGEHKSDRDILILSSYHAGFAWDDAIKQALSDELKPGENGLEFHFEYMDTKRANDDNYIQLLRQLYSYKYRKTRFATIIASDNFAFEFLRKYRDQLFPEVPVVFCGVNFFRDRMLEGKRLFTGAAENFDATSTLDILLKLHPTTREIFVLNDADVTGLAWADDIRGQISGRHPHLSIRYAEPMTRAQAIERVAALPSGTVVLIGVFLRDAAGEYVLASDFARQLAAASPVPVYGLLDLYMGYGVVGGQIIDGYHQGALAAAIAKRVLAGEPPDQIPVLKKNVARPIFDYLQLQRFGLSEKLLPEGSLILNRPYSFYEEHRGKILVASGIATGAIVLIIFLSLALVAKHRAEALLRDSQQRLTLTLEAVNDGIWDWNLPTGEAVFSARYFTMLGYQPGEFSQDRSTWAGLLHPDDQARVEQEIHRCTTSNSPYIVEFRMRKKSGLWAWILARGMVVERDASGRPLRMLGTHTDITERKQAEIALKTSEERFRSLIESMSEGMVVIDRNARITYANPQLRAMTGFSEATLQDIPLENLLTENGKAVFYAQMKLRRQGQSRRYELEWLNNKGGSVLTLVSPKALFDTEGQFIGSFGTISDITELKRAEQELRAYHGHLEELVNNRTEALELAKTMAENANRAKSIFLSNMSHELRTPLNVILGFSALMRQNPSVSPAQRQTLSIITHSGTYLLNLINDILDMAKIEAGHMQIQDVPFDPGALTHEICTLLKEHAQAKGLHLQVDMAPGLPARVRGDEGKLRQVLINLLNNAIKFTDKGSVNLRLSALPKPGGFRLVIEVEDSGPGISADDQARIFEPFAQIGENTVQKGTGLGLSITRQFVELMGGQISVSSQHGKGSCFRIELPAGEVAADTGGNDICAPDVGNMDAQREVNGLLPGQPSYRLLLINAQPDNAQQLSRALETVGFPLRLANSEAQGIELFLQWAPQLILMDWGTLVIDGGETTRRIRALKGGREVKIVALTTSLFAGQREEIFSAGVDDILQQPCPNAQLFACLSRLLGVRYAYPPDTSTQRAESEQLLTPAALAGLPAMLRQELASALAGMDIDYLEQLIRQIEEQDAVLGKRLRQHAAELDPAQTKNPQPQARAP